MPDEPTPIWRFSTGLTIVLTLCALILPFLAALAAPLLTRVFQHNAAWVLAIVPAGLFVHFMTILGDLLKTGPVSGAIAWAPSLGLRLSWYLDGLSLTFALLISGIGALIVLYSGGYLKGHSSQGRFLAFVLIFMGSMQGVVLSDSFLALFFFWELTSISSFLLIGFDHEREASRRAALQALVVTGAGGLSLLGGLLLVGQITGAGELSALAGNSAVLRDSPLYAAALALILGGAFTKSAQAPFHFWLPNAMQAPTPVSAYLHSATMVKAGVYLLMRLNPSMGGTALWETVLPLFGVATLLTGAILATRQTDLKLILAYTTVSSLGLLVMLTGLGSERAIEAACLYLVAHCLFKGALFMAAGVIDHQAGTRDVEALSGLRRTMPITFAATALAAMSMGGMPLLIGFMAKEEIYAALGFGGAWASVMAMAAICANAVMVAVALMVGLKPFMGHQGPTPKRANEGSTLLLLGPCALAGAGVAVALFSEPFHRLVSTPLATAVAGFPVTVHASAVPHPGLPLLLSAMTIMLGVSAYMGIKGLRRGIEALAATLAWGPDKGFDQAMRALLRLSSRVTSVVQNGRLDVYLTVIFVGIAATLLAPFLNGDALPSVPSIPGLLPHEWVVVAIAVIGLGAILMARNRLTAIVSLGIQGFAVALLFLLFGAPDLSFTQFMIETLAVVILALVMTRLRLTPSDQRPVGRVALDVCIAFAAGAGLGLLLLKVTQRAFDDRLTAFFNASARTMAHGRNVVNVIIVDFRGFDTLGEIAVVMIAGLAILALIRIRAPKESTPTKPTEAF